MVVVVDGAKSFQCRDGLLLWITEGQGPYVLVVGGRGWVGGSLVFVSLKEIIST